MGEKEGGYVKWFSEIKEDDKLLSEKARGIATAYNIGLPVPPGFILTNSAYELFMQKNGLNEEVKNILSNVKFNDLENVNAASNKIKELFEGAEMPIEITEELMDSYEILDTNKKNTYGISASALEILKKSYEPPYVAVRSAIGDGKDSFNFLRQYDSFLNIKGQSELIDHIKKCFASIFSTRALSYRFQNDLKTTDHSVIIQKMISSDKSGIVVSDNYSSGKCDVSMEAVWGLGEGYISGMINGDYYKTSFEDGDFNLKNSKINDKKIGIVRNSSGKNGVVKLHPERSTHQVLNNYEIKRLSQHVMNLTERYGKLQALEFAIEGDDIYLLQSNSISFDNQDKKEINNRELLSGFVASPGMVSGSIKVVNSLSDLDKVNKEDIVATGMGSPDLTYLLHKCSGILLMNGGVIGSIGVLANSHNIPLIFGLGEGMNTLEEGTKIHLDAINGKVCSFTDEVLLSEEKKEEKASKNELSKELNLEVMDSYSPGLLNNLDNYIKEEVDNYQLIGLMDNLELSVEKASEGITNQSNEDNGEELPSAAYEMFSTVLKGKYPKTEQNVEELFSKAFSEDKEYVPIYTENRTNVDIEDILLKELEIPLKDEQ